MNKEKNKPLTKTEILAEIAKKSNLTVKQVKDVLNNLRELALSEVYKRNDFRLLDLGKLKIKQQQASERYNPSTGKKIKIPAKEIIVFRISKSIKEVPSKKR